MKPRLYIQLGRAGDVLNVLPLCKRDFDRTGERPLLMVGQSFASILDGVTYVEPIVWAGAFEDIGGALKVAERIAESRGAQIVCTQIYAQGLCSAEQCSSFMRESWDRVPDAPAWGSRPLVFDRRDIPREVGVCNNLLQRSTGKPYIVLALSGTSSPFPQNVDLSRYLRNKLGKEFDFVDVSGFVAPRFYDLLTLLEGAHALVTVDSGILHLAAAVPSLDVVAFITRWPSKWHGSPWRPQQVARFFYDEAPECFLEIVYALTAAADGRRPPTIWHAWSHFQLEGLDEDTQRRMNFARRTWEAEYPLANWRECEFRAADSRRSSADAPINDPRPMPYWHDIVNKALAQPGCKGSDIIALTNSDVCFTPGLTGWVLDTVKRHGAAHTHRWDFYAPFQRPLVNEAAVKRGIWYPGSDAFFFTVRWWMKHRDEYPDMLLGREQNDEILRQLIKRHGGVEIPAAIYHEKHASYWEHHGNREKNSGNQYNRRLAQKWFLKTGLRANDPEWWKI